MKEKNFKIHQTDDIDGLTALFRENGLEISEIIPEAGSLIKCFEALHNETKERIGGARLERRKNEFLITGIAVDINYRRFGAGKALVRRVIEEIKALNGSRLFVMTKSPVFFEGIGFTYEDASLFSELISCESCEQLNKTCFPRSMCMNF